MSLPFDEDCEWPRRLLHVPSMTSMTWAPGNRYGDVFGPKYLAITYTWGRWRLGDNEERHIAALPIEGITWSVPRVSADHFTAEELQCCLNIMLEEASSRDPPIAVMRSAGFPLSGID